MSHLRRVLGTNIRKHRETIEWSQEKLAVRSKLSSDYMGRLERGEVNISIEALMRVAKALKVPIFELVRGLD